MFEQKTHSDSSDEFSNHHQPLKLFAVMIPTTFTANLLDDLLPVFFAWGISTLFWALTCYWIPPKTGSFSAWFVKCLFVALVVFISVFLLGT